MAMKKIRRPPLNRTSTRSPVTVPVRLSSRPLVVACSASSDVVSNDCEGTGSTGEGVGGSLSPDRSTATQSGPGRDASQGGREYPEGGGSGKKTNPAEVGHDSTEAEADGEGEGVGDSEGDGGSGAGVEDGSGPGERPEALALTHGPHPRARAATSATAEAAARATMCR